MADLESGGRLGDVSIDSPNGKPGLELCKSRVDGVEVDVVKEVAGRVHKVEIVDATDYASFGGFELVEETVRKSAKIHNHPNYNPKTYNNDVAVIQLMKQLSFGPSVNKINLPGENQHFPGGTPSVVTGWGALREGGPAPRQLQAVRVPIVDLQTCQQAYASKNPVTDRMICAGLPEGGKDACQGDSGGPLAVDGILVGIVSWGIGCAQPRFPGVYTSVPAVRSYIKQVSGI